MKYELSYDDYAMDAIQGSIQKISKNTENLIRIFTDAVVKNTIPEVWTSFAGSTKKMEALVNYFKIPESEEKQRIYYFAVMRTVLELGDTLNVQITEKRMSRVYSNYKYMYPVLEVLTGSGPICQGQIALKIGIDRHSLSNFFRRTNQFELWNKETLGRKNYYTITAKGKRAYRDFTQKNIVRDDQSFEKKLLAVLNVMASEMENAVPDQRKILQTINSECGKGISVVTSEAVKIKVNDVFRNREAGIRKKRQRENMRIERAERFYNSEMENDFWENVCTVSDDNLKSIYGDKLVKEV